MSAPDHVKEVVREKYGQAALRVTAAQCGCCGGAPAATDCCDPITANLYDAGQAGEVPDAALLASPGCGNPTALAELNRRKSGLANAEFLKGEIEHIPLPDNSVDVIISNCVINLAGGKDQVLKEAFRVLKPGRRFAVSAVVVRSAVPAAIRKSMELWAGCVAGALSESDHAIKLARAGFGNIGLEVTRVHGRDDAQEFLSAEGIDGDAVAREVDGKFVSAFIRAVKPASCCAPGYCSR